MSTKLTKLRRVVQKCSSVLTHIQYVCVQEQEMRTRIVILRLYCFGIFQDVLTTRTQGHLELNSHSIGSNRNPILHVEYSPLDI